MLKNNVVSLKYLVFLKTKKITILLYYQCLCSVFKVHVRRFNLLVGLSGLEPPTSRLSGVRSNQLSYKPICSQTEVCPWWR